MAELAQTVSFPRSAVSAAPEKRAIWQLVVLIALILWIYAPVLWKLCQQWWTDPNFSHGFFVPAFSLLVVWQKRKELQALLPGVCPSFSSLC
jgi:transmembrane exosortase EpsH